MCATAQLHDARTCTVRVLPACARTAVQEHCKAVEGRIAGLQASIAQGHAAVAGISQECSHTSSVLDNLLVAEEREKTKLQVRANVVR